MRLSRVVSVALIACAAAVWAESLASVRLTGRGWTLLVRDGGVEDLHVRLRGKAVEGLQFARRIVPVGWSVTADTRMERSGGRVRVGPMRVWRDMTIGVPEGSEASIPDRLEPGHSLSQTFTVPPGAAFRTVAAKLPTWNTRTSGAVMSLLRDGQVVTSRRLERVPDNSWQELSADGECGPGAYELRLSDPIGSIGWWSTAKDLLPGGEALADGAGTGRDRNLRVDAHVRVGSGWLAVAADGPRVRLRAELVPDSGAAVGSEIEWRWTTSWTRDGYDCTPRAGVVFRRFVTSRQRTMPVEQLKRRTEAGLAFDACDWMLFQGSRDADLRLDGRALRLTWSMAAHELQMHLWSALKPERGRHVSEIVITAQPPTEGAPAILPRFELSDKRLESDVNRFLWDRAFTYPSPAGPAAWFDMMAPVRCWYAGPQRDGEMAGLRGYPLTKEGYVYTWGAAHIGWPFPGPPYDTRHFDTNARFIDAIDRYYQWTGDRAFLRALAPRVRLAMQYQLETLGGADGLIVTVSKDVTGRHKGVGDNYWDILPFGHLDAYANIAFYRSLAAIDRIEKALGGIQTVDYDALRAKVRRRFNAVFWDEKAGRYIGCVDIDGARHDYGFTFVNLEAMAAGLADEGQVRRIYHWMETEPTSSGKADTYTKWIFAPRSTTIHNPMWGDGAPESEKRSSTPPWWHFGWLGTPYGEQCQDGGAILFESYFDLMARQRYRGIGDAWRRFMEIIARYRMPDRLCGGAPLFRGEIPQQENPGAVGVDLPFPESGMVPCYLLYGVMGIEATPAGLRIAPALPRGLTYAAVHGLSWRGVASMSVRVTRTSATVSGVVRGRLIRRVYPLGPRGTVLVQSLE